MYICIFNYTHIFVCVHKYTHINIISAHIHLIAYACIYYTYNFAYICKRERQKDKYVQKF